MYDAIIIGAGWAGVVAARGLASSGRSVLVLEAQDRIGGRARTLSQGVDVPIDLGCSWIHGFREGNPARDIAKELGVTTHILKPTESVIWDKKGPLNSSTAQSLRAGLDAALAHAKETAHASLPAPAETTPLSESLFSPTGSLIPSVDDANVAIAFARTLEVPFGVSLENASLRWHGWESAFGGSDAGPEGGFQSLVERVLAQSKEHNAEVRLGEPVQGVQRQEDGSVLVRTTRGEHTARTVISTIPLGVLKQTAQTLFDPPLPPARLATIARTHVGVLEKLLLTYSTAWWPSSATVGSYTLLPRRTPSEGMSPKEALDSHTIVVASFSAPTLPKQHPTLLLYLSPGPALALANFKTADAVHGAHAFLAERFGVADARAPITSAITEWHREPFSLGATSTPCAVGEGRSPLDFAELGKDLWVGRLGFAGEHTEMNHRGSVAGAIISGQREATRVLRLLRQWDEEA